MALQKLPPESQLKREPAASQYKVALEGRVVLQMLTEVGTHAWKARQRLAKVLGPDSPGDMNRIHRHLEGILESLAIFGLEIKDHTGELFDYGQSLTVVASQKREGITQEVVAETIRPTIYLQGHQIQQGEVVIDTPKSAEE
jgi:hypothetical protein